MLFIELIIYLLCFLVSALTFTAYLLRSRVTPENRHAINENLPLMIVVSCAATFLFVPNLSFINGFTGVFMLFIIPVIGVSLITLFVKMKK